MNSNEYASLLFLHTRFHRQVDRAWRVLAGGGEDLFAAPAADLNA
jgi:hypothetical protein